MIPLLVRTDSGELLGSREQPERLVVRVRPAHPGVQPADGLDVVVEDVRPCSEHRSQRLLLDTEEVRGQHLDRRLRQLASQRADGGRVVVGAAVADVVAVDRGHDHVLSVPSARSVSASRTGSSGSGANSGRPNRCN